MRRTVSLLAILLWPALAQNALAATAQHPAVVEIFTSQGCSSCPPADANINALAARPDVLALSFHVTYWDSLGWKDTFDQAAFTDRQDDYEAPLGERGPFTPQVVVDGRRDVVGNVRPDIEKLVAQSNRMDDAPALHLSANAVSVDAGQGTADIWLVRYDPSTVQVAIGRGENSGTTQAQRNVVHALVKLGTWNGKAAQFALPQAPPGLKTAVLAQVPHGGPILSAARN
ncbi:MAG: DUF1223 domain-containing protein [Rhizomicrobium sp.]